MENLNCVALQVHRRPTATDREWREREIESEGGREGGKSFYLAAAAASPNFLSRGDTLARVAKHTNVPYPGTGLKGRTDGLTDGLASKHMPSYQQKHRIKILKHLSATFTC